MTRERSDPGRFATDQEVRWCPGCGDYAVLKAVRQTLADVGAERHNTVFVSGIGCAARFPYYVDTFGLHTIHGRAPAFATGLKTVRPELDVWVITGDGDGMSIGAGHLFHVLRRNLDLQVLLFNNQIYGLTKGQASPTTQPGIRTPSTPQGAADSPADPCRFALAAGARFVARSLDVKQAHLRNVLVAARGFGGTGFVEILQNCPIYNDGAFANLSDPRCAADGTLEVEHGKPLVFGAGGCKGLRLASDGLGLEVMEVDPDRPETTDGLLRHDETNPLLAAMLVALEPPEFPVALGVIHRCPVAGPAVSTAANGGDTRVSAASKRVRSLAELVRKGRTWRVE